MDDDLQKIRQARLQELRQQQGAGGGGGGAAGGSGSQQAQEQQEAEEESRKSILNQILTPEAYDRLGRIGLVNKPRADGLGDRLIAMARTGQVRQRIGDEDLKQMLEAAHEAREKEEPKIVYQRRTSVLDDDEDDFDI